MIRGAVIFGAGIAVGMYIAKNDNASLVDMVADLKRTANDIKVAAQTEETSTDVPQPPAAGGDEA